MTKETAFENIDINNVRVRAELFRYRICDDYLELYRHKINFWETSFKGPRWASFPITIPLEKEKKYVFEYEAKSTCDMSRSFFLSVGGKTQVFDIKLIKDETISGKIEFISKLNGNANISITATDIPIASNFIYIRRMKISPCSMDENQDTAKSSDDTEGWHISFQSSDKIVLKTFKVRQPSDDEIVVKVERSLISNGTEKSVLRGDKNSGGSFPRTPGYSSVGTVVRLGKNVKEFKEGDRVFVGRGGHASYNIRPTSWCEKIPDGVSLDDAVFTRMISFPLLALRRAGLEMGESVAVVGLGQLGLFACQLAKIAGALPVIAVGNREVRRQKAIEFGADYVFDPNEKNLKQKVIDLSKIYRSGGVNVVIETSGSIEGLISAMSYTDIRGRIIISGCYWTEQKAIDLYRVNFMGYNIIGAQDRIRPEYNSLPGNWTRKDDFKAILAYMKQGRITPSLLDPEMHSPSEASEIYHRLLTDREFPLGVIFDWEHFTG